MVTLIFGDSIAWGAYDYENGGWAELLKRDGFKRGDFVYNLSVSGNTSDDVCHRVYNEIETRLDKEDDLRIIFAFGANDAGMVNKKHIVPLNVFEKRIIEIIDHAQIYTPQIYFVGLTPIDDTKTCPVSWDENIFYYNQDAMLYNEKLKKVVEQDGRTKFICIFDKLSVTDLEDGCHPNTNGQRKIFKKIAAELYFDEIV